MAKEYIIMPMAISMMDNGKKIKSMAMENLPKQMAMFSKEGG